ncbi:U2 snRNP complex subunit [Pichia kluyveri]|uniref:U2 snRNP complex subunit n=1 Tax=Pichia kluyveri TaxID=36015 RepID=A0AAV5R059_PICKL|nr:U2 snRNP complex subunit [Pichia kluyveri]
MVTHTKDDGKMQSKSKISRKSLKIPKKNNPPEGFDKIQPTLEKFQEKLKEIQDEEYNPSKPKHELKWGIHRINHQRSRYVYSLFYQRKLISKELYLWLLKYKFVDGELISKWRKRGYENLCCLECIGQTVCVCRVPKSDRKSDPDFKCVSCGCRGCSSTD